MIQPLIHFHRRLWEIWTQNLQTPQITTLRASNLITPISGDACDPNNLGITDAALLDALRSNVTIIINLASKIRLFASLPEIKSTNIDPALHAADFALTFPRLERFVWASSAYANSYLHNQHGGIATPVAEKIYPHDLPYDPSTSPTAAQMTQHHFAWAEAEFQALSETGTTPDYLSGKYPSSYHYSKYLAEQLLLARYIHTATPGRKLPHLMLFRPSCIGPALLEPFPTFEILGSNPVTTLMSFTLSTPNEAVLLPTRSKIAFDALLDEIPVDICVNQLIAHTALGTSGPVHSAVGRDSSLTLGDYWGEYLSAVPFSQVPSIEWIDDSILRTPEGRGALLMKPALRLFAMIGASFEFSTAKTEAVWARMGEREREVLPLVVEGRGELEWALRLRRKRTGKALVAEFGRTSIFAKIGKGEGVEGRGWNEAPVGDVGEGDLKWRYLEEKEREGGREGDM